MIDVHCKNYLSFGDGVQRGFGADEETWKRTENGQEHTKDIHLRAEQEHMTVSICCVILLVNKDTLIKRRILSNLDDCRRCKCKFRALY